MIGVYVYHTVVYIIMLRVLQYLLVLCTSLHTYHCQYYLDNISPLIPPTWSYFVILLSNTHISRTKASMSKITKAPMLLGPQPCGYMLDHTRLLFWIEIYAHVKMGWKKLKITYYLLVKLEIMISPQVSNLDAVIICPFVPVAEGNTPTYYLMT